MRSIRDVVLTLGIAGIANAGTVDSFKYEITDDGVTILDYPEDSLGDVVVPKFIEGRSVTRIAYEAFGECRGIESVAMPDTVRHIEAAAFRNCFILQSVSFPEEVTTIGENAFYHCSSLAAISIPKALIAIERGTFSSCDSLVGVVIPGNVTTIAAEAFADCEGLVSINIPSSVTSIGPSAFSECKNLEQVQLSASIRSLADNLFGHCTKLQSITLPDRITQIGGWVFQECAALERIDIPASVTSIGQSAFSGSGLTGLVIQPGLLTIENRAFSGCEDLSYIYFLGSAPDLGAKVFAGVANAFKILYKKDNSGFLSPVWNGYPTYRLIEYALNLPPGSSESARMPKFRRYGSNLELTFFGAAEGIRYSIEASRDLKTWKEQDASIITDADAEGNRAATIPLKPGAEFYRVAFAIGE